MKDGSIAIAVVAIAGIIGLIGLFAFLSSQSSSGSSSGAMVVQPTPDGKGWMILRANSLASLGYTPTTPKTSG